MRIWHKDLLPYLPDMQFKGQLRELVAIMHDWRDKGKTNHILINRVTKYPKEDLVKYFWLYNDLYLKRYGKNVNQKNRKEFHDFLPIDLKFSNQIFEEWHKYIYLRICMANLLEKHLGIGKSRITDEEWKTLKDGYKKITGEEYVI